MMLRYLTSLFITPVYNSFAPTVLLQSVIGNVITNELKNIPAQW